MVYKYFDKFSDWHLEKFLCLIDHSNASKHFVTPTESHCNVYQIKN